ncbi:MAG: choice-of-anchor D domain-containing protein [Dokdonella sp.]
MIKNNFVSDVNHNMSGGFAFGPDFGVVGIRLGVGTGHQVYNNSVNLFGPHTGTAATSLLSAAFSISTTTQTGIDVRNNIFANNITGGTTSIAHVSVFLPSAATSAMNLTWNNNAYYNGTDAARQGLAQVGTTAGTTFFLTSDFNPGATTPSTNFRSYSSTLSAAGTNDDSSIAFTTAVPFATANDLHITSGAAEADTGATIASVVQDIDGDSRPQGPAYDIGADEVAVSYTLTYTAGANGSITGISPQTVPMGGSGTPVTAVPDSGYHFVDWSDTSTQNPRTDTNVSANISVTANFAINTYQLSVVAGTGGTITVPASSPVTVNHGDATTITAVASAGYTFSGWAVTAGTGSIASAGSASTTITLTSGDATVTASFTLNTYQLSVVAGTGGTITVPASSPVTVNHGDATTITAVANAGYTFSGWAVTAGTGSIASAGSASTTITLTAGNATVTATFTADPGVLTISPTSVMFGNQAVGSASGAMTVTLGNSGNTSLQVTALTAPMLPFARTGTGTCGNTPITIAAGGSCTLMYTFAPTLTGPFNQTLTVTADVPGGTIMLSGTGIPSGPVCGTGFQVEVTASAGTPGPTGYATLKAGFDAINAGTHQGAVQMSICGDTTEAASAVLNASGVGTSAYTSVLIFPANGAARMIAGNLAAPLVDLNGADNVTIDGLNTGGNALTISNTSAATTAGTSTIRFIGGATGNTVTRTTMLGSSTTTLATVGGGTVYLADDAVTPDGNDNNTISNNNIGPAGTNLPNKAIFGFGTNTTLANANSGVMISNNNIYDFFNVASSVSGIYVANGNDGWTMSGNRIYQTAARTFNAGTLRYGAITLSQATTPRGSFIVMNNVIGFGAADGTGTTTISGTGTEFRGIDAPNVDTAVPTMIQGNTISGINQTTNRTSTTSTSSAFIGMLLGSSNGLFDVGGVAGNMIGSLDGSSTIVVNGLATAATAQVLGIYDFSFLNGTIANNNIGSLTIQGAGTTLGFRGILVSGTATATTTVTGNTIANITDTQVGNNILYGISVSGSAGIVTGNTIRNFTGNGNGATVVMQGIGVSAGTAAAPSTVARNTVHSLSNTVVGGSSGAVYALDFTFPAQANIVERNLVHSISVDTTFVGYQVNGIIVRGGTTAVTGANSTVDVRNNMIRLGLNAAGAAITAPLGFTGIRDSAGTAVANNYYHNSVYIGGSGVTGGAPLNVGSTAFNSDVITTTRNFQDNIFWNARSNVAAGAALHIAIRVGGTAANPPGLTSNYNDLYVTGNDGVVGVFNGLIQPTLANWQAATGQDTNSFADDPQFIAPNGSAVTGDLHISPTIATPIEGTGLAIASVTNDFDGEVRAGLTPTDVGADAGNFVPQIGNLTITPTGLTFGQLAVGATSAEQTVTLANNGTGSLQVTALTPATSPFARTGTGTCSATLPITIAVGGSCTLTYTFAPTSNGPFNQTLTVTANAPGSGTITLSGTGIQGNLTITPTNVTFGNQTVGTTSSPMPVTFTNIGNAPVTVTSLTAPTSPFGTTALAPQEAPAGFVNCSAAPFTLAAGASCSVGYTFSPTATGPFTQMLTATTNGLGGGTITLSGTGIQGALTITPATVDFGNQSVGITSAPSTVTLANTGDATLNVTTLTAATSPFARMGGTCSAAPIAITAGGSCTVTYTFTPTASGPASQVLTVTSDAPGSGTITLMGNGVQGTLVVSPTTVDFGSPDLFTVTQPMSVTLTNTGAGSLQVNSLTLAAAPFQRTTGGTCGNSLPITIAAGASCTLTYTFAPTTAGVQSQNFTVSNNGTGGSGMFTLTGNGIGDRIFRDGFDGPPPPEAE